MLRELQSQFARAVLQGDQAVLADLILPDGLDPAERLGVYRANVTVSLTDVLMSSFPVVCRLVDPRFFAYVADAFLRAAPPRVACLDLYGGDFPDFLRRFPALAACPYIGDVAALEWALHRAARAPFQARLTRSILAGFPEQTLVGLQFSFDPSLSYLESPWPASKIWQVNQAEQTPDPVDLDSGGEWLEIRRADDGVTFCQLDRVTFRFRQQLAGGAPLEAAVEAALKSSAEFDLPQTLNRIFAEGVVVDCRAAGSA